VAAGDGGVRSCAEAHFTICEDFESTSVGAVPAGWTKTELYGGANAAAVGNDGFQSAHGLEIPGNGDHYQTISTSGAALGAAHWGRVYYRVQNPEPTYFTHDTFVNFTANGPTDGALNWRAVDTTGSGGKHQWLWNVQPSQGNEFGNGTADSYTWDGMWHCAEWYMDNGTQSYHFYYDGAEVTAIAVDNGAGKFTNAEIPAVIQMVNVGINQYQAPSGTGTQWFTADIDDIALNATTSMAVGRITCQ
jgi:hypothetical protein